MRRSSVLLPACLLLATACGPDAGGDICDRPESAEPTDYHGGTVQNGVYMSSDWDGDLLHFPGGAYYRIHHELGVSPRRFDCYLSFSRAGLASGGLSHAAGNQCEVKAIDDVTITILNATCADYFVLMVVSAGD